MIFYMIYRIYIMTYCVYIYMCVCVCIYIYICLIAVWAHFSDRRGVLLSGIFFKDKTSHMVLEVIKSHVKNRGVGYATKSSCRLAKLRLILTDIVIFGILCNRFDKALLIVIFL